MPRSKTVFLPQNTFLPIKKPAREPGLGIVTIIPALTRWKQGDQEFKVILRYIVSLRPVWATYNPASKYTIKKEKGKK